MENKLNKNKESVTNFANSEYFDSKDGDYTKKCDLETLYSKSFKNNQGKYFWVVTSHDDGTPKEIEAIFSPRIKLRLTFIKEHNEIEEVKILKYNSTYAPS